MSDPRVALQKKFAQEHRFNNFGNVLMQMHVQGFRCHTNTLIEIRSPITSFCGLNGTGKSTLLQLAAASYTSSDPKRPCYYIKNFLEAGTLDPNPFTDDARVEYKFWQEDRTLKSLTISRRVATKRWSGYTRRLSRVVLFAGVSSYLPWIEQRDAVARHSSQLVIESSEDVVGQIKTWTCVVLDKQYDNMHRNTVSYSTRKRAVITVQRAASRYSEAHMGYGEARSQFLITAIEALPERSMVLIEEPEISLHPHAQHEFGRYLVDVSSRRGHQVLVTTHSEALLTALPSEARIYLHSSEKGVEPVCGLTAAQAKSLMTKGHERALHVLVEDSVAKSILAELIRTIDGTFLATLGIYAAGSAPILVGTVKTLRDTGLAVAVVLDGDQPATPKENIFKLPGSRPPEKELFANPAVQDHVRATYGVNLPDFEAGLAGIDHHDWCVRLSQRVNQDEPALVCEMARVYAGNVSEGDASSLVGQLKESSRK